jgi:hypothetical protein
MGCGPIVNPKIKIYKDRVIVVAFILFIILAIVLICMIRGVI